MTDATATTEQAKPKRKRRSDSAGKKPPKKTSVPKQQKLWTGDSIPEVEEAAQEVYESYANRTQWQNSENEARGRLLHLLKKHKIRGIYKFDGLEVSISASTEKASVKKLKDEV